MKKRAKYILIGLLVLILAYFSSYQMWLLHGKPIGKEYGFSNGFFFIEPTNPQRDRINHLLEFIYYPAIELNIYLFDGPYPIQTDWF